MSEEKIEVIRTIATETQRDVSKVQVKVDTFTNQIDKLTDISLNVSKLLAVHEQRLDAAEKVNKALPELMEQHRVEAQQHSTRAIDRAAKVESDLRAEITKTHKEILDEIKQVGIGMGQIRGDLVATNAALKTDLELQIKNKEIAMNTKMDELEEQISGINKFVWLATGGAAVVGAVLSQLSGLLHISVGG